MKTNAKNEFSAVVSFSNRTEDVIDVVIYGDATKLTYDEVLNAFMDKIDKIYMFTDEDYEANDYSLYGIDSIVVHEGDDVYPVLSEDISKDVIDENAKLYGKCLVLPNAKYEISPEFKLFLGLKEKGLLPDDAQFDYKKYQRILEDMQ